MVLFDLDGVLIDAKRLHYLSLNVALRESGFDPISEEEHIAIYDGRKTKEKLEKKLKAYESISNQQPIEPRSCSY